MHSMTISSGQSTTSPLMNLHDIVTNYNLRHIISVFILDLFVDDGSKDLIFKICRDKSMLFISLW